MPAVKEAKRDWVPVVAVGLGVAAVGVGLYFYTKKPPKEVPEGEWASSGAILSRQPFECVIEEVEVGWKGPDEELARESFNVIIESELESPEGETRPAGGIEHDSAVLVGKLIDTGYWSNVDVYFEWGRTTSYGYTTDKQRMYEGWEGEEFEAELTGLEPDTTYHFRAVVEAVGARSEEVGPGYGSDRSFTTEEVVKGFTMGVVNARPTAAEWRAACCYEGTNTPKPGEPKMPRHEPLNYVWEWQEPAPDYTIYLAIDAIDSGGKRVQLDGFYFRLRDGRNYVWDFAAHEMTEV